MRLAAADESRTGHGFGSWRNRAVGGVSKRRLTRNIHATPGRLASSRALPAARARSSRPASEDELGHATTLASRASQRCMSKTILIAGYGPGISDAVARKFGAEGFRGGTRRAERSSPHRGSACTRRARRYASRRSRPTWGTRMRRARSPRRCARSSARPRFSTGTRTRAVRGDLLQADVRRTSHDARRRGCRAGVGGCRACTPI